MRRLDSRHRLLVILLAGSCAAGFAQPAAAQSAQPDSNANQQRGPLSVGMYAGELYEKWYLKILYEPEHVVMTSTYIAAANVNYRFYESPKLPLQFEGEFDIDKHFGKAHEYELVLAPFVRWTAFPWNNYLYTNARVSLLGLSYVTGVSAWEKQNSGQEKGSNFLQFGALELTFAEKKTSPGEFFVRVHHRSGIFGLINGVVGGSNYLAVGYRVFW